MSLRKSPPLEYWQRKQELIVAGSALSYCAAWISGNGCVPINHLMEDAATAEIARVQLWQWVKYGSKTVRSLIVLLCSRIWPTG